MSRLAPPPANRIGRAVGLALALLLTGWGLARWTLSTREPPDTAPLDIRGRLIGQAPDRSPRSAIPPRGNDANATPSAAAGPPVVSAQNGTAGIAVENSARGQTDAPPAAASSTPAPETGPDGHALVTFDRLAGFTYEMPEQPLPAGAGAETLADRIPPDIRALDGQKVAVKGFMLPMKLEAGRATELLLMRDQSMCCFGVVPKINEWLNVKMAKSVKPVMDQPVTISGTLRVGAVVENGYLVYVYALDGESLATALDE